MAESFVILQPVPGRSPRAGLLFAITPWLVAAGVAATFGAWSDIWRIAMKDEEASHVFLVPFLVLWLVFVRRGRLAGYHPYPSLVGPCLVGLGWLVGHYGFNHARQAPWHLGAVLVGIGCIVSLLGSGLLWRLWPAFLVLAFLIPVPGSFRQELAIPLQTATARVTEHLLAMAHVPIERSGNNLAINGHSVAVAEACNGMRMVFPLFLVVYVFCFSLPLRSGVRLLLLLLSPVAAILCNVMRLIPTIYMFGYFSTPTAERFHDLSGWPMLPIAFLMLMGLVRILKWARLPMMATAPVAPKPSGEPPAGLFGFLAVLAPAVACLLLVGMTKVDRLRVDWHEADGFHARAAAAVAAIPTRIGSWISRDFPLPPSAVALLRPNATLNRLYQNKFTHQQAWFLLVECGDTRDMIGHYPPICYRQQGYTMVKQTPQVWNARGIMVPGTEYEFTRTEPSATGPRETHVVIRNFFVLPNGKMVSDMEGVNAAAKNYRALAFGVAQIQILCDARLAPWERDEVFATLVGANAPLIEALRSGGIQ